MALDELRAEVTKQKARERLLALEVQAHRRMTEFCTGLNGDMSATRSIDVSVSKTKTIAEAAELTADQETELADIGAIAQALTAAVGRVRERAVKDRKAIVRQLRRVASAEPVLEPEPITPVVP